jgi:hypothetical protein
MVHDIVYHGKGGYDWHTVYNMPIWLRRFTYKRISDFVEKQNKANQSTSQSNSQGDTRQIDFTAPPPPDIKRGQRI